VRKFSCIVLAVAATSSTPTPCESGPLEPPLTVLAIHWGAEDFVTTPGLNAAIRDAVVRKADPRIDYFAEYLESDRIPEEQASTALAEYIQRKYRDRRIDVVIANSSPALRFVMRWRASLFAGIPVVFSGGSIPEMSIRDSAGVTAVMRGPTYSETLQLALRLNPETERVFVIANSTDAASEETVRAELLPHSKDVALTYINEPTVARLLAAVAAVPDHTVVLYVWHSERDPDAEVNVVEIARLVAGTAPVPVYATHESYLGQGVVGGVVRDMRETGTRVGEMAREILEGAKPGDIPIEQAQLVAAIDWRQLRRWDIDASRLPSDALVRFRNATTWESYRAYIVAIVAVIGAQLFLIGGLITQRARRRGAERALLARETTLRTSYERIRQLNGRLISAQEAARSDIARELHDDVCQELVGMTMVVSRLRRASGQLQEDSTQEALCALESTVIGVVEGIRRLSHDLHPATLRLIGLPAALRAHCIEVEQRHDLQVCFSTWGNLEGIPPDVALCLFRIAQEALRNAAVHGEARQLTVALARVSGGIQLTVRDNGRGFDFDAMRQQGGLGLISLEERARLVGGTVRILSSPNHGTTIRVRVPVGDRVTADNADVVMS
jgi:signal transduction histidine kinase